MHDLFFTLRLNAKDCGVHNFLSLFIALTLGNLTFSILIQNIADHVFTHYSTMLTHL